MMDRQHETFVSELETEYCPPLDVPLVRAIISDFDIGQPEQLAAAREALEELRCVAVLEEATGFDASGSGGGAGNKDERSSEDILSATDTTEPTVLSKNFSSSGLYDDSSTNQFTGLPEEMDSLSLEDKERLLTDMFPSEKASNVQFILRKSEGNIGRAMDELLNHVFFQEKSEDGDQISAKGVDAFFEDSHMRQRRKRGKAKRPKFFSESSAENSSTEFSSDSNPTPNKWQNATKDVEFISSRTQFPPTMISSLYHEQGASLSGTIKVLLERQRAIAQEDTPPETLAAARQLCDDFPYLAVNEAIALISMTAPSTSDAHQLAKAIFTKSTPEFVPTGGNIVQVIPRYAPIVLPSDEDHFESADSARQAPTSAQGMSRGQLNSAYSHARSQASASYRKAKSDPLYGGAAAYYAENGRAYSKALHEASAADADQLVAAQSGRDYCDLHGVAVKDGTRIASARVAEWWNDLGEGNIEGRRWKVGQGYKIIVGIGRHSKDGKARLGPAVAKKLMSDGWKVEMAGGEIYVRNIARRR